MAFFAPPIIVFYGYELERNANCQTDCPASRRSGDAGLYLRLVRQSFSQKTAIRDSLMAKIIEQPTSN